MTYNPALAKISDGFTRSASAILIKFNAVTLRSPRSILPICERSISAMCASASCEVPCSKRTALIAQPKACNRVLSPSVQSLLDTQAFSQEVPPQATAYTTQNFLDAIHAVTHDGATKEKKMRLSVALLIAILSAAPANSQTQGQIEKRYSAEYNQCIDASDGVTASMLDCTGAEIDRQDSRLNNAYSAVMRALSPAKKAALRQSERAWIRQRDARCARSSKEEGDGTLASVEYADCILDETIRRTIFLENHKG